ncbi:hypothetical protein MA16_Dca005969 [Dendrobium catenatum]|uniref:Uncharacterized protein n=1 Tax=Dendrobium catenatum TaxID=906689 RepID=A0A2I0WJT8_9ASPA|nr:hypothetical protein MA16_Dca005969 [Dendrobium catenatum]
MAVAGKWICSIADIDETGGLQQSLEAVIDGLGYASPPIIALLFILMGGGLYSCRRRG